MTNNQIDRIMGGVVLAIGVLTMIGAWRMPRFENLNASPWEFVGLTPMVIGFFLAVCGAILILRKPKTADGTQDPEQGGYFDDIFAHKVQVKRFVSALVLTLIYGGVLFGKVDFIWATAGFLFAFFMIFTWFLPPSTLKTPFKRVVIKSLVFAVGTTGVMYTVFEKIFLVQLP